MKTIGITVNGKKVELKEQHRRLSYYDVVGLAFGASKVDQVMKLDTPLYTVTYRNGENGGTMHPGAGNPIEAVEDMVFNCTETSGA